MKNSILFLVLISFLSIAAQEKTTIFKGQNTVYYEFFGTSGTPVSIQYDRILKVNSNGYFNASLGFGTFFKDGLDYITIPSSINYTTGINKNHFEIGIPIIYQITKEDKRESEYVFYGIKFAYKYQVKNKFFFKVSTNLLFDYKIKDTSKTEDCFIFCDVFVDKLQHFLGLSFGYSF